MPRCDLTPTNAGRAEEIDSMQAAWPMPAGAIENRYKRCNFTCAAGVEFACGNILGHDCAALA